MPIFKYFGKIVKFDSKKVGLGCISTLKRFAVGLHSTRTKFAFVLQAYTRLCYTFGVSDLLSDCALGAASLAMLLF